MVSNQEAKRAAVRAELVAGITRCGGTVNGEQCARVHGETVQSAVSDHSFTIVFSKAVVVDSLVVPLCARCAARSRVEALPIDEAVHLAEQQLAISAPVIVPIARPQTETPKVSSPVPRKDEQEAKGAQPKREPKLSNSMRSHLKHLANNQKFEDLFTDKPGLCSCGRCPRKPGKGFAAKNGDYAGPRFPLCRDGVDAAIRTASALRSKGDKPAFLIFRDEADWMRFDVKVRSDAELSAKRGQAILAGQLANIAKDTCAVFICGAAKPTEKVVTLDAQLHHTVEHRICSACSKAARRLSRELRQNGQRWSFRLLRRGEKLSPRQEEDLRRTAQQLRRKAALAKPKPLAPPKSVAHPASASGKGSFHEQLAALVKKTEAATPEEGPVGGAGG